MASRGAGRAEEVGALRRDLAETTGSNPVTRLKGGRAARTTSCVPPSFLPPGEAARPLDKVGSLWYNYSCRRW